MSTAPSPDTRAIHRVLQQVLEPRPPAEADLRITHSFLTEDPRNGLPAFHYWAAGIDPDAEDSAEQMAQYLAAPPQTHRSSQVYRVCRRLSLYSDFSESTPSEAPREALEDVRITYLLWSALTCPHAPRGVLERCNEAGHVNLVRATGNPLFQFAMRRLAARPSTPEVQR